MNLKYLTFASLISCLLINQFVFAQDTKKEILKNKSYNNTTLSFLNESGTQIPENNTTYPESGYILQATKNPQGTNVITKYEITDVTKSYPIWGGVYKYKTKGIIPHYYEVISAKKNYGSEKGTQDIYYKWTTDENGIKNLTSADQNDYDIVYHLDSSRKASSTIRSNQSGKNLDKDFYNFTGTYSGGAIYNYASNYKIGNITGDFIGNSSESDDYSNIGGAIYNRSDGVTIGDITGNFINNNVKSAKYSAYGGAIYNYGSKATIGNIKGDFIGNYAETTEAQDPNSGAGVYGGAIYNSGNEATIGNITGNFIGNYTKLKFSGQYDVNYIFGGGALFNNGGNIKDIIGDFINNYADGDHVNFMGGCILNVSAKIGNISGDFINNYNQTIGKNAYGGSIANINGDIKSISGDFINNYTLIKQEGAGSSAGGAIYNFGNGMDSKIEEINGDFINNYAQASNGSPSGGAIYNTDGGKITTINGNFIKNYTTSEKGTVDGGAISNYSNSYSGNNLQASGDVTIDNINGSFLYNYALSGEGIAHGGAISNNAHGIKNDSQSEDSKNNSNASFKNIIGDFIGNYAISLKKSAQGGAIYNLADNTTTSEYTKNNATIENITGNFIDNKAQSVTEGTTGGGAIYNAKSEPAKNSSTNNNENIATIKSIKGDFINNISVTNKGYSTGGAIYNSSRLGTIQGNFIGNIAKTNEGQSYGGAIYNIGTIGNLETESETEEKLKTESAKEESGIYNSNFYNNHADTHGGAIFTSTDLNIISDGTQSVFAGNTINNGVNEAIYVSSSQDKNTVLSLITKNNGIFILNDSINGNIVKEKDTQTEQGHYILNLTSKDNTGTIHVNNDIKNADIINTGNRTEVYRTSYLNNNNSLTVESGEINIHDKIGINGLKLRNFDIKGGTINIDSADVNLAQKQMGKIAAETYNSNDNDKVEVNLLSSAEENKSINLNNMRLLVDGRNDVTEVEFADSSFSLNVTSPVKEAYAPIWKYSVDYTTKGTYRTSGSDGYFIFSKIGYNPSVLAGSIAQLAGGYTAMLQSYKYAFEHADTFSGLPYSLRTAKLNANKYSDTKTILPAYYNEFNQKGIWFKPYNSFESIGLKNGPKVDTILYGSYAGIDSEVLELRNGWKSVYTGYIGYNGSNQRYQGNQTYQNGGLLGLTDTFYKNNFYTAITASVGSSIGQTNTMYGQEDFTMLLSGIASKTGYSFEFKDGKYIIQPNLLLSYTFINTFNYTTAAGLRMHPEAVQAIQINPSIKFIINTKSGWQPYIAGGFAYNILGKSQSRVNDLYGNNTELPALSIKPYAEYGVGIQKLWHDKYAGFLQVMMRNGGRNGVSLSAGFRWAIGKEKKSEEK